MDASPCHSTRRRLRRRGGITTAAAAILAFGLLISSWLTGVAAQGTMATIQAVPDSTQLSSKGSQAGCDHYRNGYLGMAMCVNFYDEQADGGEPVVQVIGSLTNEGQVDICNLTLAVEGLANATYRSPTWLPKYPATQSFKAGTYVPFTVILPLDLHSSSYPSVDVLEGFYACDAALKPLPEDQVVPPLPSGTGRSGTAASNDHHPGAASNTGLKSKIKWEPGLMASAGSERACLRDCLDTLNKHTDDCAAAHYVLHSGCIESCPHTVAQWTIDACTNARCKAELCVLKTSGAPSQQHATGKSTLLLATLAMAAAMFSSGGGGPWLW